MTERDWASPIPAQAKPNTALDKVQEAYLAERKFFQAFFRQPGADRVLLLMQAQAYQPQYKGLEAYKDAAMLDRFLMFRDARVQLVRELEAIINEESQ